MTMATAKTACPPKPAPERPPPAIPISVTIPQDVFNLIEGIAQAKTQTRSAVVTRLCRAGLEVEQA